MVALTREQRDYLEKKRVKITELRKLVIDKYTPAIFENIKQIRETVRNLSITSGAIAAFSLSLFGKEAVKNETLLAIAFFLLLFVVWEGYFYLKLILEAENNRLCRKLDLYNAAITEVRVKIDNLLRSKRASKNAVESLFSAKQKLRETFEEEDEKTDNWFVKNIGNLMLIPFSLALLSIILSFIEFS